MEGKTDESSISYTNFVVANWWKARYKYCDGDKIVQKDANTSLETTRVRDHLANERTFLAWCRTSLGIIAFGFVVQKFSLFLRKIASLLQEPNPLRAYPLPNGFSSIFGILLIVLGATTCGLAFLKFKLTEKQINENNYNSSNILNTVVTMLIIMTGVFMVVYLSVLNSQA